MACRMGYRERWPRCWFVFSGFPSKSLVTILLTTVRGLAMAAERLFADNDKQARHRRLKA